MRQLEVKTAPISAQSYTIHIGTDTLGSVMEQVQQIFGNRTFFIITDANVLAAGLVSKLLPGGSQHIGTFVIEPAGEVSKHMQTVTAILEMMERRFMGRDSCVLALGGGTVGDIAGFVASIFKRGVPVVQIPTTTVSQADSAIGGKTGVDSTISKNAYGTFFQPSAVFIDVATLKTLDERQYRAGLVESVKHALIADKDYFAFLENNMDAILARDTEVLEQLAYRNCGIKASVVEQDPFEMNLRRVLNYGHTIGHAVESASDYGLLHGEAVAIGIAGACILEEKLGLDGQSRRARIMAVLNKLDVPTRIPAKLDINKLIDLIAHDKKALNQWPRFVLLEEIGKVHQKDGAWAIAVPQDIVKAALKELY